jgi:hypothetical protein
MIRSSSDPNMYHIGQGLEKIILVLYVDDLFLTSGDEKKITWLKSQLHQQFDMTDLEPTTRYLGIEFTTLPNGIFLSQREYILEMLAATNMQDCKHENVPLPPGLQLLSDMNSEPADIHNYCTIVGKLIFLTTTRPDIAYAVNSVSRYMSNPQAAHLNAVKHILCYLQKTLDYGLFYQCLQNNKVEGFTDADWASCPKTRRSTGGYLFTLFGAAITWQSKRQLTVTRSSTESEYVALSDRAQEAVWLGRLLREIGAPDSQTLPLSHNSVAAHSNLQRALAIPLHCDNQSSLKIAKNPIFHARTKHIEVCHHYVRERALDGEVKLHYISIDQQPADVLTKALSQIKFERHRADLGLVSFTTLTET